MSAAELKEHLIALDLMRSEAAQLLGVSARTVTRWSEGEEIPGPAQAALRAWRNLKDRGLAWKPDSVSVLEHDADQIERQRLYAIRFNEMLKQVELRGGPKHPWKINCTRSAATFGTAEVNFHKLANGGFSISSYRRTDRHPDMSRDMPLIEDAAYCIAKEFARFGARAEALTDMANYVRTNAALSARDGPKLLTPKQATERKQQIERLAAKLMDLAEAAREGAAAYAQYEAIEDELHAMGFFPTDAQVAAVARAFV